MLSQYSANLPQDGEIPVGFPLCRVSLHARLEKKLAMLSQMPPERKSCYLKSPQIREKFS